VSVYINSTTRCLYEPEVMGIHELCFHPTPTMLLIGSYGSTGENRFLMRFWCSRRSIAMLLPFSTVCCHRLFPMFRGSVNYNRQCMYASCSSFYLLPVSCFEHYRQLSGFYSAQYSQKELCYSRLSLTAALLNVKFKTHDLQTVYKL
jgi:hypothetical protein